MNKKIESLVTYQVGGYVRDRVLGKTPRDLDYVVIGSTHEEMVSLGFTSVGVSFGVYLHPITNDEYALARTEKSTGPKHTDFEVVVDRISLEEDLGRRDFTINAIAMDADDRIVSDPFGGVEDIKNEVLRCTSPVSFVEDPLRILRLARFTAKFPRFTIDRTTKVLAMNMREQLKTLTPERILKEVMKLVSCERPSRYFTTLDELGLLDIVHPELYRMKLTPQGKKWHYEGNVFNHTLMLLDTFYDTRFPVYVDMNEQLLLGCLFHDLGKNYRTREKDDGKIVANGHDDIEDCINGLDDTTLKDTYINILRKQYAMPNKMIDFVLGTIKFHHIFKSLDILRPKKIINMVEHRLFPNDAPALMNMLSVFELDSRGRLSRIDGVIIDNDENYGYNSKYIVMAILKLKTELKTVNARQYVKEHTEASVESIKMYLIQEKVKITKKWKHDNRDFIDAVFSRD